MEKKDSLGLGLLIPLRAKYKVRSPKGFKSKTNNKTPKEHSIEWHLNEALRKKGQKVPPKVGRSW